MELEWIRRCGRTLQFELTDHADKERKEDKLRFLDIADALASAVLLEDYPEDRRGHSCLLLGYSKSQPIHVVAALHRKPLLVIITVYCPTLPKWRNERERNETV